MVTVSGLDVDEERLARICRRYGITELFVFGSTARGADQTASDLDLLYTLAPDAKLGWDIEDLSHELEALFHRPVDLVSKRHLHHRIRDDVLADARVLYAA